MTKFVNPQWQGDGKQLVWDSEWFAVAANSTYTKTHSLNVQPLHIEVWFSASATGGGESRVPGAVEFVSPNYLGCRIYDVGITTLTVHTQDSVGLDTTGSWANSGYYRVLAWA